MSTNYLRVGLSWVAVSACFACAGGQTGDSGTGGDCDYESLPVEEEEDLNAARATAERYEGTYRAPLHWLSKEVAEEYCPARSSATSSTELEITMEPTGESKFFRCKPDGTVGDAEAASADSPGALYVGFEGRVRTEDGVIDDSFEGYLDLSDGDGALKTSPERLVVTIGPRRMKVLFRSRDDGLEILGFVEDDDGAQGVFPTVCWDKCDAEPPLETIDVDVPFSNLSERLTQADITLAGSTLTGPVRFELSATDEFACSIDRATAPPLRPFDSDYEVPARLSILSGGDVIATIDELTAKVRKSPSCANCRDLNLGGNAPLTSPAWGPVTGLASLFLDVTFSFGDAGSLSVQSARSSMTLDGTEESERPITLVLALP